MNSKCVIFLHFPIYIKKMNIFLPELYSIILSSINIYYVYSYSVSTEASLFIH